MKHRPSLIFALIIGLLLMAPMAVLAESGDHLQEAEILKTMGLFMGSDKGFELDRPATRAESSVMLVRLLGKEEAARNADYAHPFADVPSWASPYVGYMYHSCLTKGISADRYGAADLIDSRSYITFLLRALGYDDQGGDFMWSTAESKAIEVGLMDGAANQGFSGAGTLLRDDMVGLSYRTLGVNTKEQPISLVQKLINEGAVAQSQANFYVANPNAKKSVVDITSGLEFFHIDWARAMNTFVVRDQLPESVRNFVYIGVLSGIDKADTPAQVLSDFYADTSGVYGHNERYNTAGFGSSMVDFATGNCAVFLFDANKTLIGFHLVKEPELSIHKSPFVDLHLTLQSPYPGGSRGTPDFEVIKLVNGKVDPDYLLQGGYWDDDGNKVVMKCFLSGENVDYQVRSLKDDIVIKDVQIRPAVFDL